MATTEKGLQNWGRRAARELGCAWYKLSAEGVRGFPDILVVGPTGKVAFIELKSPRKTGRISPLQDHVIGDLRAKGVSVYICDDRDGISEVLRDVTQL